MPAQVANGHAMSNPLEDAVTIIPGRLYFKSFKAHPSRYTTSSLVQKKQIQSIHFFSIDNEYVYWNFFLDFGPLNLGQLYKFCTKLNHKLNADPRLSQKILCFYSSTSPKKQANAAFLICAWQVLYLNRTPEDVFREFQTYLTKSKIRPSLPPFHDASPCVCTFNLTVLDCLCGLVKARKFRYFDFKEFDVKEYEHFEQVENGDLNWIIKDRIIAFAGPQNRREFTKEGYCTLAPEDYIPYFKQKNVSLVVRFNKKYYDKQKFIQAGMRHADHYYSDGSIPQMKMLQEILSSFESVPREKAFAVHCKAGLGRTGTCIGAYMMKQHKFTAAEAIGWIRICRPGSVIGPQQHFLQDIEQQLWHEGDIMRLQVDRPPTESISLGHEKEQQQVAPDVLHNADILLQVPFESLHMYESPDTFEGGSGQGDALRVRSSQASS